MVQILDELLIAVLNNSITKDSKTINKRTFTIYYNRKTLLLRNGTTVYDDS